MPDDPKPAPYIEFRDVSKAFGDNVVLDHVSFDVLTGETVCILGRSGVGKSVSLHHIMGFLKPDSGRVIVAGEDITDYTELQLEAIRKKVTMVFPVLEVLRNQFSTNPGIRTFELGESMVSGFHANLSHHIVIEALAVSNLTRAPF